MPAVLDTHDWLQAIDDHPDTTSADLLAAYRILGVPTTGPGSECDVSVLGLQLRGFLGHGAGIGADNWQLRMPTPNALMISIPRWLYTTTSGVSLLVQRSVLLRDSDEFYLPVVDFVKRFGLALASREVVQHPGVMMGKAEISIWEP